MVSPVRKRQAVDQVQKDLDVSERRACVVLGQVRSTQRYKARLPEKDAALVAQLQRLSREDPRHGYRMVTWLLRCVGVVPKNGTRCYESMRRDALPYMR